MGPPGPQLIRAKNAACCVYVFSPLCTLVGAFSDRLPHQKNRIQEVQSGPLEPGLQKLEEHPATEPTI